MTAPFRYLVGALNNKKVAGLKQLDELSPFFYVFNTNTNSQFFAEIDKYLTRSKHCSTKQKHPCSPITLNIQHIIVLLR